MIKRLFAKRNIVAFSKSSKKRHVYLFFTIAYCIFIIITNFITLVTMRMAATITTSSNFLI